MGLFSNNRCQEVVKCCRTWLALVDAVIGSTVRDIVFRDVHAVIVNLTDAAKGTCQTQLADLDRDCSTLHRRLAHVTKSAKFILNHCWVDVFVAGTRVEYAHRGPEHKREDSKDADECP